MKIGIDCGHNAPPDTGAVGIKREDDLTLAVGKRVISRLRSLGHTVTSCTPRSAKSVNDSLLQRAAAANNANVDFYTSIHFNVFDGKANGTEVFAISQAGQAVAGRVLNEICNLGFTRRGVKDGAKLYVLRNTNMPAILIECCFIDSPKDMALFDTDKMAEAIASALSNQPATTPWNQFVDTLKSSQIRFPQFKPVQLAQAILESGRGTSNLFLLHNNPYGMKWRKELSPLAVSALYKASDGVDNYCHFLTLQNAVEGYWTFISREPYKGWEQQTTPIEYLQFISDRGYSTDPTYIDKAIALMPEATKLLS